MRKTIAIINRNHVLIRLSPSPRRMEFSEATGGTGFSAGFVASAITARWWRSRQSKMHIGGGDLVRR
jgi:hypothetical protein